MYVGQMMTRRVITVSPDDTIGQAFSDMLKNRIAHLPVMKKNALVGIISDRDLRKAIISKKGSWNKKVSSQLKVSGIMTSEVMTADVKTHVAEAVNMMLRMGIGSLPVMAGAKLKGIVTKDDLLGVFVEMLRTIESSSTIDVELVDEIEDVAAVFSVLRKHKASVISYSASPKGENSHQVCHFRLKLCPVNPIVDDLKKKKVKVLEAYGDD